MKRIPLTKGKFAIVDDEDFEELSKHKWNISSKGYACRMVGNNPGRKQILMHREILRTPKGLFTDHIDGNKSNNQRSNLRFCTAGENMRNRKKYSNNTTGFKGVTQCGKYISARIQCDGRVIALGSFSTLKQAAAAYIKAAKELFGEFLHT